MLVRAIQAGGPDSRPSLHRTSIAHEKSSKLCSLEAHHGSLWCWARSSRFLSGPIPTLGIWLASPSSCGYVLLRLVNRTVALLMGWLRLGYAAMFAAALTNLLDVAQLLGMSEGLTLPPEQLDAQVMMSLTSFHSGFEGIALAIFGLHLFALGYLVFKSTNFPRFLGALVAVAGAGYLFDSFGTILGPNYALTVGAYTFLGEVLLIFWLLWRAVKGFPADEIPAGHGSQTRPALASPMSH